MTLHQVAQMKKQTEGFWVWIKDYFCHEFVNRNYKIIAMKKIILSAFVLAMLAACGGAGDKKAGDKEPASGSDLSSNPDYQKGLALVGKSDCFTCHKIDEAFVGPTYKDVANKYKDADAATVTKLAENIIKGSRGVWGEASMTPHASISQADAEAMVKYILLLKK